MNTLRGLWRAARLIGWLLRGLWILHTRFAALDDTARQREVQRWSQRVIAVFGVELRVLGSVPGDGPLLVLSNHVSWLDIVIINAVHPLRFVSKSDVRHWPVIGSLVSASGTLFIERERPRDALRVVHHMAERLREGDLLGVFPEGTTSLGETVLPFHANLLQSAIAVDAPIQPLALAYVDPATGLRSEAPSFVGDDPLPASLWRTMRQPRLLAVLVWGEPQTAQGRERRVWAADLRLSIQDQLQQALRPRG